MGKILLIDSDVQHAGQISWALRSLSCQTTVDADIGSAIALLRRQTFDIVVIVTIPGFDWDVQVEFIRHAALEILEQPKIICLLRGPYGGPNERVYAARKGFKVVYEQ